MTAIPAAIEGLLELLRVDPALPADVRLEDGPWMDRPEENDVIAIGWLPEEGATVEWTSTPTSLGNKDQAEFFSISGLVSSWNGDGEMKAARSRADFLLEAIRTVVKKNPRLGGAVARAQLATVSASQYQTDKGCEYAIQFTIQATVF